MKPSTIAACSLLALSACAPAARPLDGGADVSAPDGPDGASAPDGGASFNPHCGSDAGLVPYPPEPHEIIDDAVLPDLSFSDGQGGTVRLSQYFEPCASRAKFLVLRQMAAWGGPSQWHAEHTARALRELGPDVQVLDLLALGRDNLPATAGELAAWRARFAPGPNHRVVLDPEYRLRAVYIGIRQLPVVVVVDLRTMRAVRIMTGPDQHALDDALAIARARAEGRTPPPHTPHAGEHALAEDQLDMLRALARVPAPPPSPTNRYADDPRAAALGERLFNDTGLSAGGVSCASCHQASRDFTDGRPTGLGVAFMRGGRNTPTVRFAPYTRWLFWDGRADSVWSQAIGPIENPIEMRSTRLQAAHTLYDRYRAEYEAVFGPMPALSDSARFPAAGKPGDPAYDGMSAEDRVAIDRVFANLGKAIEAFERTLRFAPSAVDRYAAGDASALTAEQRAGMHHFFANGCIQCHHGPMLTDDSFHNVAMPTGQLDGSADRGRVDGIAQVRDNPFNAGGSFSDAPMMRAHLDALPAMAPMSALGMMHTPGLRGAGRTGPWGHGGTFTRLEDLMLHYASGAVRDRVTPRAGVEDLHLGSFHMDAQTLRELASFVNAL